MTDTHWHADGGREKKGEGGRERLPTCIQKEREKQRCGKVARHVQQCYQLLMMLLHTVYLHCSISDSV